MEDAALATKTRGHSISLDNPAKAPRRATLSDVKGQLSKGSRAADFAQYEQTPVGTTSETAVGVRVGDVMSDSSLAALHERLDQMELFQRSMFNNISESERVAYKVKTKCAPLADANIDGHSFYNITLPRLRDEFARNADLNERALQIIADGRSVTVSWCDSEQRRANENMLKSSGILERAKLFIVVESEDCRNNIKRPCQMLHSTLKSTGWHTRAGWPLECCDSGDERWPSWDLRAIPPDLKLPIKDPQVFPVCASARTENGTTTIQLHYPLQSATTGVRIAQDVSLAYALRKMFRMGLYSSTCRL